MKINWQNKLIFPFQLSPDLQFLDQNYSFLPYFITYLITFENYLNLLVRVEEFLILTIAVAD